MDNQMMMDCINECMGCHQTCLETLAYSAQTGGQLAEAKHLGILTDCAQICQTSADFMIRGSEMHTRTCAACAEVCDTCARSCERFANEPKLQECMEVCQRCAEACRKMSGQKMAQAA